MKIEIVCNTSGIYGGVKRLYRIAKYLKNGGHMVVVNMLDGSNNTWFAHDIPENQPITPDIRICPETCQQPLESAKNIVYVQAQFDPIYEKFDKVVTTTKYLESLLSEEVQVDHRIPYGFNSAIFKPSPERVVKNRIGIMPRKGKQEYDLLKSLMPTEDFLVIDGLSEIDTARALQTCDFFFAISRCEGFGMPPFEASLCGSLVIGYHGKGGAEWLTAESFVPCGFPQEFQIQLDLSKQCNYESQRKKLASIIRENLTLELEEKAWLNVINDI